MTSLSDYEPYVTQELVDRGHARRMDLVEDYFAMIARQKLYRNFSLYAEVNQPFNKLQLAAALRSMLLKYPILASTIIPKRFPHHESFYASEAYLKMPYPDRDYIKVVDRVDLCDILLNEQAKHRDLVEEICAQFIQHDYKYTSEVMELVGSLSFPEFDGETPNWRILCLPSSDEKNAQCSQLVYVSNHCSSDGISGVNFLQDLTKYLADAAAFDNLNSTGYTIIDYPKDYKNIAKFPPPITSYVDYNANLLDVPKLILSNSIKDHLTYKSEGSRTTRLSSAGPQRYHNLMRFSEDDVLAFKRKVKKKTHEKCSLTPFFQACFLVSLHRYGKIFKGNWTEWGFDVALANNTRKHLPDDSELRDSFKYGPNVGGLHYSYLISSFDIKYNEESIFWSLVDYYHGLFSQEHEFLIGFGILMSTHVCQKKNLDDLIIQGYLNRQRGGLLLSNVGYHKQDRTMSHHINDMVFSQTTGALKFTFALNMISTSENGLNIDLNVAKFAVQDRQEWLNFCKEFETVIRNFT